MSNQLITYQTTDELPCENCLPSDIVLCVPGVLTANGLGFIEGTLQSFVKTSICGVGCRRTYTFQYDNALLEDPNTPLLSCEISGVFCKDCQTRWLEDLSTSFLTGWITDALGNLIQAQGYSGDILYNDEIKFLSNTLLGSDSGGVTLCGGGSASTIRGATIDARGVNAGGALTLKGAFSASGNIIITQGAPTAPVLFNNYLDALLWNLDGTGNWNGDATRGGDIVFNATGKTVKVKSVANGKGGTFILNGATPVTVSNTSITVNSIVIPTLKTVGGTVGALPSVKTITAATGFTVAGTAADTSTYNYIIFELV